VGAVDVDHVERDRDSGDPLRLRHELLGKHRWGHRVEYVDGLDRNRSLLAELPWRQKLVERFRGLDGPASLVERRNELGASREVAIDGGARDSACRGHVGEGGRRGLVEEAPGGIQYPLAILARVCSPGQALRFQDTSVEQRMGKWDISSRVPVAFIPRQRRSVFPTPPGS
jgi:hypothetical protein